MRTNQHHWVLTARQLCDIECLLTDVFSPLTGFLNEADYLSVCEHMRLSNHTVWPMPITLDVSEDFAMGCELGDQIILRNAENTPIAKLTIESIWQPNKTLEAEQVFGTTDETHPGVYTLMHETGAWYIGGTLQKITIPAHYDFVQYRHTPAALKQLFQLCGWSRVIAFQTRNPMHRAHFELTQRAAKRVQANLLLHPVVGLTKPGDIDYRRRIQCYEAVLKYYDTTTPVMLSVLPIAMRMAGPREALWHAIIRKNYGATHFIVGRDHAGPGLNQQQQPFYGSYDAQALLRQYQDEIAIEMVASPEIVYVKERDAFVSRDEIEPCDTVQNISGTALRAALKNQTELPAWFSFPEVLKHLKAAYRPKHLKGFTLFFTGLSGAGKSTLAKALEARLQADTGRPVTLLDGDVVRRHLSKGLGFSKADRDTNIERLGYVASEITKHHGITICAAIAPYDAARQRVRRQVRQYGEFIEIHVSTPLLVCEARDTKGLYEAAKAGEARGVTGVDAPYEVPMHPEMRIDTSKLTVLEALEAMMRYLKKQGVLLQHVERSRTHA